MHAIRNMLVMLRGRSGESLVEAIVAFVVVTVALLAFSTFAISGSHLTAATTQSDDANGSKITQDLGGGDVKLGGTTIDRVTITGNDGQIYSYKKK